MLVLHPYLRPRLPRRASCNPDGWSENGCNPQIIFAEDARSVKRDTIHGCYFSRPCYSGSLHTLAMLMADTLVITQGGLARPFIWRPRQKAQVDLFGDCLLNTLRCAGPTILKGRFFFARSLVLKREGYARSLKPVPHAQMGGRWKR